MINNILDSKKDRLVGRVLFTDIIKILNDAFKNKIPFKFKLDLNSELRKNDFAISGFYYIKNDKSSIIVSLPKKCKYLYLDEKRWCDFRFCISQVCQHEAIHHAQWSFRDRSNLVYPKPIEFKTNSITRQEEREYLNDIDEIDAYAHDIAMEIKYFYPKKDPNVVLSKLKFHSKIWSYRYYRKVYRGSDWSSIHKKLLRKVYMWLPRITV